MGAPIADSSIIVIIETRRLSDSEVRAAVPSFRGAILPCRGLLTGFEDHSLRDTICDIEVLKSRRQMLLGSRDQLRSLALFLCLHLRLCLQRPRNSHPHWQILAEHYIVPRSATEFPGVGRSLGTFLKQSFDNGPSRGTVIVDRLHKCRLVSRGVGLSPGVT